jgi:transketolase
MFTDDQLKTFGPRAVVEVLKLQKLVSFVCREGFEHHAAMNRSHAAGLASADKKVFAVSPGCFLTARSPEQIKNDVAYSGQPVKLIGISAGVSHGAPGSTHHSLHDLAVIRTIHNIDFVAPADNFETREAIRAALDHPQPVYIRFGKKPMPHLHGVGTAFKIGKSISLMEGNDLTLVATGETVPQALSATRMLAKGGLLSRVLSVPTVKPLE